MFLEILKRVYTFLFDTIQTILLAASVFLVIYLFLFRPFEVSGESMFPTFKNGEFILTNLVTLRFNDLKKGDVVVFQAPTDHDKDYIKRVIGVPGDTVEVRSGLVYVNGQQLDESQYLGNDVRTSAGAFLRDGQPVRVPDDSYIVMGDNRPHSSDSREWGFLKKDELIGKSFFVYWPPTQMRLVENP
ncbi:MAG: signal peptidase I [Candidatus Levybacteria bacterium]|nr:signal peptidase I [Candidatus Levybacteria bacterium]